MHREIGAFFINVICLQITIHDGRAVNSRSVASIHVDCVDNSLTTASQNAVVLHPSRKSSCYIKIYEIKLKLQDIYVARINYIKCVFSIDRNFQYDCYLTVHNIYR